MTIENIFAEKERKQQEDLSIATDLQNSTHKYTSRKKHYESIEQRREDIIIQQDIINSRGNFKSKFRPDDWIHLAEASK